MFLDQCKCIVKKKMLKYITDDTEISYDEEENFDTGNYSEKNSYEEKYSEE